MIEMKAKCIVKGYGEGEAIVLNQSLSIFGQINMLTGELMGHDVGELRGKCVKGKILFFTHGMAASGTVIAVNEIASNGVAPAAIVQVTYPDTPTVQGCIMSGIPVVSQPDMNPFDHVKTGDWVEVDSTRGIVRVIPKKNK